MFGHHTAVFFPGQGVLDTAAFQKYQAACPEMFSMLADVDAVARRFWRTPLSGSLERGRNAGGNLDLLIFVASVTAYKRLQREGVRPRVLIGHGFGEIAALVAADALSLSDGAETVARRFLALESRKARYAMAAVKISPSNLTTFLRILKDSRVSVAVENSSTESVIVGPAKAITAAEDLARLLGIHFQRLRTTCGPHQASMNGIKEDLVRTLSRVAPRPLRAPVYSPLLGRPFRDGDDFVAVLAEQLVQPLRFADAVRRLVADGVTLFIECGPLRGLAAELDCAAIADTRFHPMSRKETEEEIAPLHTAGLEVA